MRITRKIDDLGRVVIPKEIRKALDFREGSEVDIDIEQNQIIITKHNPRQLFTVYIDDNGNIVDADTEEVIKQCAN